MTRPSSIRRERLVLLMDTPKFFTVDEVAAIARAPRSSVFHWIYSGKLSSQRIGKRRLISARDLNEFLDPRRSAKRGMR